MVPCLIGLVTTSLSSEGDADSGCGVWSGHQATQSGLGCSLPGWRAGGGVGGRVQAGIGWGRAPGLFL